VPLTLKILNYIKDYIQFFFQKWGTKVQLCW